jgi:hypothetical protein
MEENPINPMALISQKSAEGQRPRFTQLAPEVRDG